MPHRTALLVSTLATLSLTPATNAAESKAGIASGVVYHDLNANGKREANEPGLEGVRVSNGKDVTLTDAKGRYAVPVDDDEIIFVVKPRGYQTSLDELNVPRFYYIHKPSGSPDDAFLYKGVEPTGALPSSVDFPLVAADESDSFSAMFVGDPQPYSKQEVLWYTQDVIAELTDTDATFGVSLGDLVGDRLELFENVNQAQSLTGLPWYNVFGNHDMNFRSPSDEHSDETFERVYGPPNYAFQYGRVHFIVLDNVIWQGYDGDRKDGRPRNRNYRGGLRPDQLRFVENLLKTTPADDLVVLMFHIPIEGDGVHRIPEQRELFRILSSHPRTLSLSGHTHFQRHWFFGSEHGYTAASSHHHLNGATGSGSWYRGATDIRGIPHATMRCGAPNGYNIISFDGADYTIRYKAANKSPDHQIRIWTPGEIHAALLPTVEIVANVFGASEKCRVWMRIDGAEWTTMDHSVRPDPHLAEIKAREVSETPPDGRRIPDLVDSHHIWAARIPANLKPGYHVVEVRATNMFGQQSVGTTVFRVVD